MKKNGYNTVELIITLAVFSVVYFTLAVIASKDFNPNYETDLYNQKIAAIEKQAAIYAQGTEGIFADSDSVYMTIGELAEANAVVNYGEGIVVDPRNEKETLNDIKVKITKENDKVTAKILS